MKSCFFIGHRDTSESILSALIAAVEQHITEYGVTEFYVGNYGNFDRLATQAVKTTKGTYPQVKLYLLLPYHPTEHSLPVPSGFDGTFYPSGMEQVPRRFAIFRANRFMVDSCTHLITYVCYTASNTAKLVQYAQTRHIHITNLEKS